MRVNHENVVELIEVCAQKNQQGPMRGRSTFFLVFAFCEHDLAGILSDRKITFSISNIRCLTRQILTGALCLVSGICRVWVMRICVQD